MRISFNWLRELVDVSLTPVELAKKLTMAGFEVESIEDKNQSAQGVVVGKVVECVRFVLGEIAGESPHINLGLV